MRVNESGFSLIEVLITMVVMAVGLLGLAVLQLKSVQFSQASMQQSIAASQASDLAERLWSNLCVLEQGGVPERIIREWSAAHTSSMPKWASTVTRVNAHRYQVQIKWANPKASAESMSSMTGLRHVVELPATACSS